MGKTYLTCPWSNYYLVEHIIADNIVCIILSIRTEERRRKLLDLDNGLKKVNRDNEGALAGMSPKKTIDSRRLLQFTKS